MFKSLKRYWIKRILFRGDPVLYGRHLGARIGKECRILDDPGRVFGSEPYLIRIGDHVTITNGVRFITHDGGVWVFRRDHPDIDVFGNISIGDNVFIGFNALILPNVRIGENCVIGAGSVVTRSIPKNTVAAGTPARPVKTIDEYWQKIQPLAFHIRSLPPKDKARALLQHFEDKW